MNEQHVIEALGHVQPVWDDARAEIVLAGMQQKRRRRVVVRVAAAGSTALVVAALLLIALGAFAEPDPTVGAPSAPGTAIARIETGQSSGNFYLPDGSIAVPVDAHSRLVVQQVTDEFVSLRVAEGRCDFVVTPRPGRVFEVLAGDVTTTVLGTDFSVGLEGDQAHVRVSRGRVRVEWAGGSAELDAGMDGLFPPAAQDQPGAGPDDMGDADGTGERPQVVGKNQLPDWRRHARSGEFEEAARALDDAHDVRDTVEDLLLAADAMRLSGRPAMALPYLKQVAGRHHSDPRAPLAEFTRGRVLLLQLGRPRAAAAAFRSTRQLAPVGSLAQDALAREVEAWHRAGEPDLARQLALEYTRLYPKGRRLPAVRRFGGLD